MLEVCLVVLGATAELLEEGDESTYTVMVGVDGRENVSKHMLTCTKLPRHTIKGLT